MRPVLAAPLLLVALSGCLFGPGSCYGLSAVWTEPGLYETFPEEGERGGFTVTWNGPPEGLPLEHPAFDDRWGKDRYAVEGLALATGEPEERGSFFRLVPNGTVSVVIQGDIPEETVRARFDAFASNITDADGPTRASWADAFLANRSTAAEVFRGDARFVLVDHRVRLPLAALDPAAALEHTGLAHAVPDEHVGGASVHADGWRLEVGFATKEARRESAGANLVRVDVFDRTEVHIAADTGNGTEARARVTEAFDALGLPEPSLQVEDVHVDSVC